MICRGFEMVRVDWPVELPNRRSIKPEIPKYGKPMNQGEMGQVEDQRHFTKCGKNRLPFGKPALQEGQQNQTRAQGHQKIMKGWGIFGAVQE